MQLPLKVPYELMITRWASILNPLLKNPLNGVLILKNIVLAVGTNQIPHKLAKMQSGWFVTDINGVADIYRNQPFNETYLYLSSSGVVTISLGVF